MHNVSDIAGMGTALFGSCAVLRLNSTTTSPRPPGTFFGSLRESPLRLRLHITVRFAYRISRGLQKTAAFVEDRHVRKICYILVLDLKEAQAYASVLPFV